MGALKRYRNLGGGNRQFYKFTEIGQTLEGIWRGSEPNKFNGENGIIETPDGVLHVFSLSTMLKDLLKLPEGAGAKVIFWGMKKGKTGNTYGNYQTQEVLEGEDGEDTDNTREPPF